MCTYDLTRNNYINTHIHVYTYTHTPSHVQIYIYRHTNKIAHTHIANLIIINLIYIAQFDTNGILTALYIVITYIQMQYVHV